MTDIYQAPAANLGERTVPFGGSGSIANGLAGNYDLAIGAILSEAWARTKGSKGIVWLAFVMYMVFFMIVSFALNFVLGLLGISYVKGDPMEKMIVFQVCSQVLLLFVSTPLATGLWMLGVKLAVRAPVEATEIFSYFKNVLSLVATMLLWYLLIAIGFCLLIIPGIYLSFACMLAMPLVVEKNMGPWEALQTSRKAITHHWFKLFGLYLVFLVILFVSMIPLGIGLIWTLPMSVLLIGIIYRTVFGFDGEVSASAESPN